MTRQTGFREATIAFFLVCACSTSCSTAVSGRAVAIDQVDTSVSGSSEATSPQNLSGLLLSTTDFPAPYEARVLATPEVAQASPDLTGVQPGAEVDPVRCAPPEYGSQATQTVMIIGSNPVAQSTITEELNNVEETLEVRKSQIEQCPRFTASQYGATSTIRSVLLPAPPINADSSFAVKHTIESGSGNVTLKQSILQLLAQIGGIRITVTYRATKGAEPDSAVLDEIFTAAVLKVRKGK
ncbi:MAG: sensor domain-containing protein [Mycobacteriaceae bacterium]